MRPLIGFCLVFAAVGACASPPSRPQVRMPRLGVSFEKNTGRWPKQVEFVARTGQGTLFLTRREMVLALQGKGKAAALRLKLQGANPRVAAVGVKKLPGIVNYFLGHDPGKWRTKIPTYSGVRMAGVYPGIDLVTYGAGKGGALEYDFVVKPGADPRRIRLALSGAKSLNARNGALVASTACGDVLLNRPYAYQTVNGVRKQVACSYTLERNRVAFQVARYDTARPLVVDPVLEYSTFLGGSGWDYGSAIAVDATGAAYVTGETTSADFPTSSGAYQSHIGGSSDIYVAKLDLTGQALIYCTYLGGSGNDNARGIVSDSVSNVYVTGHTTSCDFPTTVNAFDMSYNGLYDTVLVKLNKHGTECIFSTMLGGSSDDLAIGLVIDSSCSVYCAGSTDSFDFPATEGAFAVQHNAMSDVFIIKLSSDGGSLVYSGLLGGGCDDFASAIAVDNEGSAYVTGRTVQVGTPPTPPEFPTTVGAFDTSYNGDNDAFVVKLNADGTALVFSSLLGGGSLDIASGIAVDNAGAVYVTGWTRSSNFPTTVGAYCRSLHGDYGVFVTKLNAHGSGLAFSTLLDGTTATYEAYSCGIAVDSVGAAYVAGTTNAPDFPVTIGTFDPSFNGGGYDSFLAKFSADGTSLAFSTYLGGSWDEYCNAVTIDGSGAAYVMGQTRSVDFPVTPGAYDTSHNGGSDAFVAKFDFSATAAPTTLTAQDAAGAPAGSVTLSATLRRTSDRSAVAGSTVAFSIDGAAVGSGVTDASGLAQAAWIITAGPASRTIRAAFAGDGSYLAAEDTATLTVLEPAPTAIYVPDRSAPVTDAVVLKGYLYRAAARTFIGGKSLAFTVAGTSVGSATTDAAGEAALPWVITPGDAARTISVAFAGDSAYLPATGTGLLSAQTVTTKVYVVDRMNVKIKTYTVLKAYLFTTGNSVIPGKTLTMDLDGTALGSQATNSGGCIAFGYTVPDGNGAGIRVIRAGWAGNAGYTASANTGKLGVVQGEIMIWPYVRSVKRGTTQPLKAYVRSMPDYVAQPGKSIAFAVNGTGMGSATVGADGWAAVLWSIPADEPAGAHTATAAFAGDAWYGPATESTTFNVVP